MIPVSFMIPNNVLFFYRCRLSGTVLNYSKCLFLKKGRKYTQNSVSFNRVDTFETNS